MIGILYYTINFLYYTIPDKVVLSKWFIGASSMNTNTESFCSKIIHLQCRK